MIENFENITYELTPDELKMVDILVEGFKKIDKNQPKTAPEIVRMINDKYGKNKITQPRLRKYVNYIRANGLIPLIATSKGYFVTHDKEIIKSQIKSLRERANAINKAATGLETSLVSTEFFEPIKKDKIYE